MDSDPKLLASVLMSVRPFVQRRAIEPTMKRSWRKALDLGGEQPGMYGAISVDQLNGLIGPKKTKDA